MLANSSEWFHSLIVDGVIGGIGGTLPFFPLIFTLFLGITLFEDSGYMATRTLENEQDRKITALIAPLMTCGAKLPIYAMFVSIITGLSAKEIVVATMEVYLQ